MWTWAEVALLGLQIVQAIMTLINNQTQMKAGTDAAIAKAAAAILLKTKAAKDVMAQVTGMTDAQVDEALKGLEP